MKNLKTDVVIIGGGAAGMMAAATSAQCGRRTILLERNEKLGKKVYLTGKGRCNVTNNTQPENVIKNIPVNSRFLYSSIYTFGPAEIMQFFENLGVRLKTERGNRVFPQSDKSSDIISAMTGHIKSLGVQLIRESAVSVLAEDGKVTGVRTENREILCESVVIATGGLSYPATGSTGDGHCMAKEHGHTVTPTKASLVPLESSSEYCSKLQGLSLRNIALKVINQDNKIFYQGFGEMLFTHFGVTGPLILSASSHLRDYENNTFSAVIDLKPALDAKKLDARILRDFNEMKNKDIANVLVKLLPKSMIPVMLDYCKIPADTKINAVTKEQRRDLEQGIKSFTIEITGTRPIAEAIVTSGGVKTTEINPSTMESKLVKGLFFAGEVMDVDAYTGGFNLSIAWSTGHNAGNNA